MPPARPSPVRPSRRRFLATRWLALGVVAVGAVGGTAALAARAADGDRQGRDAGVALTGETNAMGMPVAATPGSAAGTATAARVVVDGANWELGTVPLDIAVRPAWTLRNTGDVPVTIGNPHTEIREGCCPGPYAIGTRTLAPGDATTLTFELSMHPGMDGWHDMVTHLPITPRGGPAGQLALGVTGEFRN